MILKKLRNNLFSGLVWWMMLLCFFNISVDVKNPLSDKISVNSSFNDQESIIELVVEKLLGYDDAIPESDEPDMEEHNGKSTVHIDLFTPLYNKEKIESAVFIPESGNSFNHYQHEFSDNYYPIHTPPPEA